jgi:hypothetical protein
MKNLIQEPLGIVVVIFPNKVYLELLRWEWKRPNNTKALGAIINK